MVIDFGTCEVGDPVLSDRRRTDDGGADTPATVILRDWWAVAPLGK